jgi:hypothetical protein
MAYTDINSEDRLVQATFADHLEMALGWESVYAWNQETFSPDGRWGAPASARWCWRAIRGLDRSGGIPRT